jgi:RND family efflux transporter MFP subunit
MKVLCLISMSVAACGCGGAGAQTGKKQSPPPAQIDNGGIKEADLARIRLSPEAEKRLGIETAVVQFRRLRTTRAFAGECVIPPGQVITLTAPVSGTLAQIMAEAGSSVKKGDILFRMAPFAGVQRDLLAAAENDVAAAQARVDGARLRLGRAEKLLRGEVGSVRQKELAEEELRVAEAGLRTAQTRLRQIRQAPLDADTALSIPSPQNGVLRQLLAGTGQMVPAGVPLAEIARLDRLWIRVPIYAGEAKDLDPRARVEVRILNAPEGPALSMAEPADAPPTADPFASTVDFYYSVTGFRPGERVNVAIPTRTAEEGMSIPWAAILFDIHGGAWVYQKTGPQTFERKRVQPRRVAGRVALLERGVSDGAEVVTAGAAELFGIEFGPGK